MPLVFQATHRFDLWLELPLRKDWVSYYFLAHLAGLLNSFLGLLIYGILPGIGALIVLKKTSTLVLCFSLADTSWKFSQSPNGQQ